MLFISTFINKIDKKGRVSVPANFRASIKKEEFQGIVAFPSFVHQCIEASTISHIQKLSDNIDELDPYSEERDAFATSILGGSFQLSFDTDGRILLPENLIKFAKLDAQALFIGKGSGFEIWQPNNFKSYQENARRIAKEKRYTLKINNFNKGNKND